MNQDEITNIVQLLLTAAGAILVTHGLVTSTEWTALAGAVMGLVGPVWSIFYSHWNMKKVPETAKVIGGALIAFLLLLPASGYAADLKNPYVKAPPSIACTTTWCTGAFVGGNLMNTGTSLDVIGQGLQGVAQNGLGAGGQFGFEYFNNNIYASAYCSADYDVALNTIANVGDRSTWGCGVRAGYSLSNAFGAVTTTGTSLTLPQQFLQSLMTPYFDVAAMRRHGQPATVTGGGVEALLAADPTGHSSYTINASVLHYSYNQGGSSGTIAGLPATQTGETLVKLELNKHFGWSW